MSSEFGILDLKIMQKPYRLKAIKMMPKRPGLVTDKFFPETKSATNIVEWETQFEHAGLARYVDKNGLPNQVGEDPVTINWQEVAYKEESYFVDHNDLRWERKAGSDGLETLEDKLFRQKAKLSRRVDNRNEWEGWHALRGAVAIKTNTGSTVTLDYKVPSDNKVDISGEAGEVFTNPDADVFGFFRKAAQLMDIDEDEGANVYCSLYIIDQLAKSKQVTEYFGDSLKQLIATEGRIKRLYGFDFIPYDRRYTKDYVKGEVKPKRERFIARNELFILSKDEAIGERPIAASAKSGGKSQRFVRAWEENGHKMGTWLVVGEYSLPIIRNRWAHIYAKVCADPDAQ